MDESWPESAERSGVFQPYLIKFMCNKSSFQETDNADLDMDCSFVDYSGWQFNFYKSEREFLPEETNFSEVQTTEVRESALSLEPKDYEKNERKVDNV